MRLLRPIAWITFLLPFTVGFGLGITSVSNPLHILFAFLSFFSWMSFSFIMNAIADKDVDKFHDGRSKDIDLSKQPIATNELSKKKALYFSVIPLVFSLVSAWFINPLFFLLILFEDVLGYIYSMPPLRLKTKPISDILCNALAAGAIFVAGLSIGGANMNLFVILGAFFMASIFYIPTVVTDYTFDRKAGLTTSAVFFGPKKILLSMYPLTAILVVIEIIVLVTTQLELQALAMLIIIYTIIFTLAVNYKLKKEQLYIHENWILVPFAGISIAFVLYGLIKFFELVNI